MSKTLDFNTLKKRFLTVKLADENKTTLLITMPTKAIFDEFIGLKNMTDENINDEILDEIYGVCAKILSCNKNGIKISKDKVIETFDFEDAITFIEVYTEFISEVTNQKN